LSTKLKEKEEKIQQIIAKLTEDSAKGVPIIVEGKKDAQSLRDLGVYGRILTVKTGGKSFLEATTEIETIRAREVILLLDFDRRGKEGIKLLKQDMERLKIKPNTRYWFALLNLIGKEVQCIESLPSYMGNLKIKTAHNPKAQAHSTNKTALLET
jgi:2,5-diamino-6-(ribosylamino)-4(3H)-pyrimidinone 5'-phosphate reductase